MEAEEGEGEEESSKGFGSGQDLERSEAADGEMQKGKNGKGESEETEPGVGGEKSEDGDAGGEDKSENEEKRDKVVEAHGAGIVFEGEEIPEAAAIGVTEQAAEGGLRMIEAFGLPGAVEAMTVGAKLLVEIVVLIAEEDFGVAAGVQDGLFAKEHVVDEVGVAFGLGAKGFAGGAEGVSDGVGDEAGLEFAGGGFGEDASAATGSAFGEKFAEADGDVVLFIDGVGAEDADVLAARFAKADVEGEGSFAVRIGENADVRMLGGDGIEIGAGAVGGTAVNGEDFDGEARSLLSEERIHAFADVGNLVEDGEDDRNERGWGRVLGHGDLRVC